MPRFSFASLRARLLLLVLLAIIPALGLTLYSGLQQRRLAAIKAQEDALELVRVASAEHERLIEGARQLLVALAQLPAVRRHDSRSCSAFFANLLKQYSLYANIGAIEPNGDLFCSALPFSGLVNLADRAYFRRVLETRDFAIGEYQIGRVTGKATVNFGYPVLDEAGLVQAVVFAALDLAWLNQLAAEAHLPAGATLTVVDRRGLILARYPDTEKWVGQSAAGAPIFKAILGQGEGVAETPGLDGLPRLSAFTSLRGAPEASYVYVSISIPKKVAFAEANRLLARNLAGLGLVGMLALLAAFIGGDLLLVRRVKGLVSAATRLGAGDLASRVEVTRDDELGELATAFNTMADRLQAAHGQLAAQLKELERRQQELSLLHEIDQKLLAGVALPDLLQAAVEAFARLAGAPRCVLVNADPESGVQQPVAIFAPDPDAVRRYYADFRPRVGEGGIGMAIGMRTPVWSSDITRDPRWGRLRDPLVALGVRAILAVPFLTEGPLQGAVSITYPEPRTFTDDEIQILQGFANQLAVATEQGRLREEAAERWRLEEANRVKALFIANMSHELRTPLNSVIGFSQLLEEEVYGPLNEKQKRYVGNIHASGKHLLALINDILDLSKVEVGKIDIRPEPLLLPEALDAAVTLIRDQALKKCLALQLEVEEGLPQIMADPIRLRQILFNLLSNAVKFTPEGGSVTVTARRIHSSQSTVDGPEKADREPPTVNREQLGEFVEIAVQDTGIGIKPEDLPKLFQEFVRLDTTLAWRAEGTGLGLALTKRLVELHGGQIFATSEGPGRGSTFTMRLPLRPSG